MFYSKTELLTFFSLYKLFTFLSSFIIFCTFIYILKYIKENAHHLHVNTKNLYKNYVLINLFYEISLWYGLTLKWQSTHNSQF